MIMTPYSSGLETRYSVKVARLAVETNVYPLYEIIDGKYTLSRRVAKPKPVSEYLELQSRFRHLTEEDVATVQNEVNQKFIHLQWLASKPE